MPICRLVLAGLLLLAAGVSPAAEFSADVIVYGGTSGGVMAAVQVARMKHTVILIEPSTHLGGLSSGGLGATDIGNKAAIGGLSREFYQRIGRHYSKPEAWRQQKREEYKSGRQANEEEMWTFEPHVAEALFFEFVHEAGVTLVTGGRLDLEKPVGLTDRSISAITLENGDVYRGRIFIDATYEGDLMAKAGVSYHVGREANATYNETLNGVQTAQAKHHQFKVAIDPFVTPGDPASGLLKGIQPGGPGTDGEGDARVQAYNFRMCMTDVPENRLPWPKPAGYDPQDYELLRRYIESGTFDAMGSIIGMPNRKTDMNNNGGFSTDNIGMNYDYPNGDYKTRKRIFDQHVAYQQGMMYFLANDKRLPPNVRDMANRWGLARDEFTATGGWPHQMYVREARRMISDVVMTQHHCQGRTIASDAVGLAAYTMDSHNVQRYAHEGRVYNEGDVQIGGFPPYPIAYGALVPREKECSNLFVPVCLAASHIAYGSIRMEPVFMVLGQSSATAAVLAIEGKTSVQKVEYIALRTRLLADGQVLEWTGPRTRGLDPAKLAGIVVDDAQAKLTGEWSDSASIPGFVGSGYKHDGNANKGDCRATFTAKLPSAGMYEVRVWFTPNGNRATNVPITVATAEGDKSYVLNQRKAATTEGFVAVATVTLSESASVTISNTGTDGHVILDAVQFVKK